MMKRTASADGPRYQTQATFRVTQPYDQVGQWTDVWTHSYTVTVNPWDGTFEGTGKLYDNLGAFYADETIIGTFGEKSVSLTAARPSGGVMYSLDHAPFDATTVTLATTIPQVARPIEMRVTTPQFTRLQEQRARLAPQPLS